MRGVRRLWIINGISLFIVEVKEMNKRRVVLNSALVFAICSLTALTGEGQELVKCKVKDKSLRSVKYRKAYSERSTVNGRPSILICISVKPEEVNREFLVLLAHHLNQRFCREERLVVAIFIDYKAARYFNPNFQNVRDAWRGEYFLDRRTGEEYVSFTPSLNYEENPQAHIRIDLRAEKE